MHDDEENRQTFPSRVSSAAARDQQWLIRRTRSKQSNSGRAPPNRIPRTTSGFQSDLLTWTGEGSQGSAARAQAAGGVGAAGTLSRSGGRS